MKKRSKAKFAVEKVFAEGLPPGWTKEVRVKKKGRKTRKDPYYIHPESEQVFRSLKEVFRYIETKDCSKREAELTAEDPNNVDAQGSSLPSEAEKLQVGESKADGQLAVNERLNLGKKEVIKPNGTECCASPSGNTSQQSQKVVEENDLENNKDSDSSECQLDSACLVRENEEERPPDKEVEKHGHRTIQKKRKKLPNKNVASLPRRTSKRLAGIEADASLDLKPNIQITLASPRLKVRTEAVATVNNRDPSNINKGTERPDTGNATNESKQKATALPVGELHSPDGNGREIKGDKKSDMNPESSVNEMWLDPCIEFAVKTLTGAIPIRDENKVDETPQSSLSSSAGNPQPSLELPFGDIWSDPCFAFAVKTLTGEIPITDDFSAQ